jgi:hypothetical protein
VPAIQRIVERKHWRFSTIIKSACAFGDHPVLTKEGVIDTTCIEWNKQIPDLLKEFKPTTVLFAQSIGNKAFGAKSDEESVEMLSESYSRGWSELQKQGAKIAVIRDTPRMGINIPGCLASRVGTVESCSRPKSEVLGRADPLVVAANNTPGVYLIDMNDSICTTERCPPVIGNVLVWRDSHHLTGSYVWTLTPKLAKILSPFVEGSSNVDMGSH